MTRPHVRMNYDPSEDPGITFEKQGRTKQSEMAACDINNIMKHYAATGQLPDLIKRNPQYGDFSSVPSYQESLHIVAHAEEQFAALDAKVRARFNNQPSEMLDFMSRKENIPEAIALGLAIPRPSPAAAGTPLSGAENTATGKGERQRPKATPPGADSDPDQD